MLDYILNGAGNGSVAQALMDTGFDVNILRPWKGRDGNNYMASFNANTGKFEPVMINNTGLTATLRKDDWIHLDAAVIKAARARLKAVATLRSLGLTYNLANGFGKTVLQHETMSDIGEASISMDAQKETQTEAPAFDLTNLPLPIIHKDFEFSTRQLSVSRNSNTPLDVVGAERAARSVAELAEKLLIGTYGTYTFGGGSIYGMTNFPQRMTKSLTLPTAPGWTPSVFLQEVLEMRKQCVDAYHYGPFDLYLSTNWDQYLDDDYSSATSGQTTAITLRKRAEMITGINSIVSLDYLSGYQAILCERSSDVIREVIGMDITTVQWEPTPFKVKFKVMAILVPQLRADFNGRTGIVHGVAA